MWNNGIVFFTRFRSIALDVFYPSTDEIFKSSAFLPDVVFGNELNVTGFEKALGGGSLWEFLPKNPGYLARVQLAMTSWKKLQPQQAHFKGNVIYCSGTPEN